MQQADDFLSESQTLFTLASTMDEAQLAGATLFKNWTVNEILRHLHVWNTMAFWQIDNETKLADTLTALMTAMGAGKTLRDFEAAFTDGLAGGALVAAWRAQAEKTATAFSDVDPKRRVKWAGPDMSARSSMTARQMETWAHGQAIFDLMGVEREENDRIRNIVVLGVNTFRWTYMVRSETPPETMPHLALTAPSGALWTFGEENDEERIEGLASEFCQVVTQTRNIADTALNVAGETAQDWMSKAQCFAGGVETPPPPGARRRQERMA